MSGRHGFVAMVALMATDCGGGESPCLIHDCFGTAVIITATPSSATAIDAGTVGDAGDGGTDAEAPIDGGDGDGRPSCTGTCYEYLEVLRVAVEAATPAVCIRRSFGTSLICVPSSTTWSCPRNTLEEGRVLEAQIRDYLSASWPEISSPLSLDFCPCRAYRAV